MLIAALYDIHANLPALEAVIAEMSGLPVSRVVIGGDVVPGPMPRETLEALVALPWPVEFIQGNGERDTLAIAARPDDASVPEQGREPARWTGQVLSAQHLSLIQQWSESIRIEVPGLGSVLFCHATPGSDREIFTVRTPAERLLPIFANVKAAVVMCGHTHMQFDRRIGSTRVVNAGSVGMPFGAPGAYWALIGTDIELRYTAYDTAAAAERIRASDYPHAGEFAAVNVEHPPSEERMLALFERVAVS